MSLQITILIVLNVLLVNVFMLGIISYWGVPFNFICSVHMSFAIGVAVDYSSHIGHAYLMAHPKKKHRSNK